MSSFLYDFSVLGGDMRQVFLAQLLAESGNSLCCYALPSHPKEVLSEESPMIHRAVSLEEACAHSGTVLFPFPFTQNGSDVSVKEDRCRFSIQSVLDLIQPGQAFFAGCIPPHFQKAAKEKGISVYDYSDDPALPVFNSIATAEGAVCEAILHSPFHLHKSQCAVLGFGKCGRSIVSSLKGLSANVSVFTDDVNELAQAFLIADESLPLSALADHVKTFRFVFNTIPAQFIHDNILKNMNRSALIIDIASSPGGVDLETARRLGIPAFHCPGLPGKYAPASSAQYLKDFIQATLY